MEGFKLNSFQITAAVRIKPLLSQENVDLRRAAFRLFGDLTSSVNVESKMEAFKEQLEGNLITFLLHLSDPDINVVKVRVAFFFTINLYLMLSITVIK